jgi:hypothetical protein
MLYVKSEMVLDLVLACQNTLVTLILVVVLSVYSTLIVHEIKHVQIISAEIRALALVALMLSVESTTMHPLVHVCLDILEIHSMHVIKDHVRFLQFFLFQSKAILEKS